MGRYLEHAGTLHDAYIQIWKFRVFRKFWIFWWIFAKFSQIGLLQGPRGSPEWINPIPNPDPTSMGSDSRKKYFSAPSQSPTPKICLLHAITIRKTLRRPKTGYPTVWQNSYWTWTHLLGTRRHHKKPSPPWGRHSAPPIFTSVLDSRDFAKDSLCIRE